VLGGQEYHPRAVIPEQRVALHEEGLRPRSGHGCEDAVELVEMPDGESVQLETQAPCRGLDLVQLVWASGIARIPEASDAGNVGQGLLGPNI
jgi:hypothetical protein